MTAKKKPGPLGDFEEDEVAGTAIRITNAGDGLSEAVDIDPAIFHRGDTVYVVLETQCKKVLFDEYQKDDDRVKRVHILKAGVGTIVDKELVESVLTEQKVKNQKARDAAKGVEQFDLDGEAAPAGGEPDD